MLSKLGLFQRRAVDLTVPRYLSIPFPHTLEGPGQRITKHSLDQGNYTYKRLPTSVLEERSTGNNTLTVQKIHQNGSNKAPECCNTYCTVFIYL